MPAKIRNFTCASVLFWLMIPCLCRAGQIQCHPSAFDGHWWLSVSDNERRGFVEGYFDCYSGEYKGSDSFSYSYDQYVTWITERYQGSAFLEDKRSVVSEMHALRDRPGKSFVDHYAEPLPVLSGLEWGQMDAIGGSQEQRGFLEGYLAYYAVLNHGAGKVFSKSADTYVSDIDGWYGYARSTGDMNPDREDTPIADVLFMFADRPGSSNTH